jgi:hypothetical protein
VPRWPATVVAIEHNLDVVRHADWLIDVGPGPGRHGDQIRCHGLSPPSAAPPPPPPSAPPQVKLEVTTVKY